MGEDFIEKRNRQIRRSIDRNFEKYLKSPDLFSNVPPGLSSEVVGVRLPGVELSPGQTLVHLPQPSASNAFVLCSGATRAVELSGEAAAHAAQSGAISAEITSIKEGFVALKFHAPYSRN
jgi:hypothetical protein